MSENKRFYFALFMFRLIAPRAYWVIVVELIREGVKATSQQRGNE